MSDTDLIRLCSNRLGKMYEELIHRATCGQYLSESVELRKFGRKLDHLASLIRIAKSRETH